MKQVVRIRKYRSADLEQCRALWSDLVNWHRQIYQDNTIGGAEPEHFFDKYLTQYGSKLLWVAVNDTKVVGLVGLIFIGDEAELEPLIVSELYRHMEVGTKLVHKTASEARKVGIKYLNVRPVARNRQAIEFFYKQGFTTLGRIELSIELSDKKMNQKIQLFDLNFQY